jgi:hypothetical protein
MRINAMSSTLLRQQEEATMGGPSPDAATDLARDLSTVEQRGGLRGRLRVWWHAVVGVIGVITGVAPHVLHHVGLLAGTALVAGAGGTTLFAVVGLAASVPLLLRLRRRFHTWWAPAIGLTVFATMFAISTLVIGPAIQRRR